VPHAHHHPIIIIIIIIIIIDMMRRMMDITWLGQYCSVGVGWLLCCTVGRAAWPRVLWNWNNTPTALADVIVVAASNIFLILRYNPTVDDATLLLLDIILILNHYHYHYMYQKDYMNTYQRLHH
jgi:hypothetical protein